MGVPYRYDKGFSGIAVVDGAKVERRFYHYVYDLDKPNHYPVFERLHARAKVLGAVKTADLGRGQIVTISAADSFASVRDGLAADPAFLIRGPL